MGGNGGVDAQCNHTSAMTAFGGRRTKNLYFVDGQAGKVPDTEIRGQRPVGKQCALPNIK